MSLFTIYLGQDEAHVACDTLAFKGDGSVHGIALKARPLLPRNIVIAGLGAYAPYDAIVNRLMQVPGDLDALASCLTAVARSEWARYWSGDLAAAAQYLGVERGQLDAGKLQIALVGYSAAAKSFICYGAMNTAGQNFDIFHFKPPQFICGPIVAMNDVNQRKPKVPDDLVKLAKRQYDFIEKHHQDAGWSHAGCGGELLHYHLKPKYMTTKVIHRFPNYESAIQELEHGV